LVVFETEHGVAEGAEVGIPFLVCLDSVRLIVDRAIQFHDESALRTKEIHDIVADLVLAPEFQVRQLPIPKQRPHRFLRRRLLFPKFPGLFHQSLKMKPTPPRRALALLAPLSPWERGWG
jgi:hypothetical protein